jgi:hypothetical protein
LIRFVDLGKQLGLDDEWPRQFAFFDTISDTFMEINGSQVWDSWMSFHADAAQDTDVDEEMFKRMHRLTADWVIPKEQR